MQVSFQDNAAFWQEVADGIAEGAEAAAEAMARYLAERARDVTLKRTSHEPGEYWKTPAGEPPAYASGSLAEGMYWTRGSGGLTATAEVGNTARHAKLMEYGGCEILPVSRPMLKWHDSGGWWSHHKLPLEGDYPAHPFLAPTIEEAVEDGELQRVALEAFGPYDP